MKKLKVMQLIKVRRQFRTFACTALLFLPFLLLLLAFQPLPLCSRSFPCPGSVRGSTLTEIPWPGTIVTICMNYFMIGGSVNEHGTNKPPLTRRVQDRSKGDITCPTTSQNPSHWHPP